MRVLYVNHTSRVSGGERSLITLLRSLPSDVEPIAACPPGELQTRLADLDVPVESIPGTDGSLRPHPLQTPRALTQLGRAGVRVARLARSRGADLVHANSIRSGLVTAVAKRLGGPPVVVHVRDCLPPSLMSRASFRVIDGSADAVIANSEHTRGRLTAAGEKATVIHNAVELERFQAPSQPPPATRQRLGLGTDHMVLALVAQITPWKAQDDAIRIVAALRADHPGIRLMLIGSPQFTSAATRYDNDAYLRRLRELVAELDAEDAVMFLGHREDVPDLLAATDLVLLPSWEEPFGRAAIEAMAAGVPVVATNVGGPVEIIDDGDDGLLLPPRDPSLWANRIAALLSHPEAVRAMGRRARAKATSRYGTHPHVAATVAVYRGVLEAADGRPAA